MNLNDIKAKTNEYFVNIYSGRYPLCFTGGDGVVLHDISGKDYIDFTAGISTNCLGYNHPKLKKTITKKAGEVLHCSNLFYIKEQADLAEKLCQLSFGDKVFFANSGSEANEGAVKMAMRYFYTKGETKHKVITINNSFHGRTMAMVAATAQPKYQKAYSPVNPNFVNIEGHDIKLIEDAIDENTCAIMIEPVQCEAGMIEFNSQYIKSIRKLCDDNDILLIFDEVQTGIGRTGKMFGYEHLGVEPDIMTLAKGLAGGIPIGAIVASNKAHTFMPGDHGTTFGGNPLACACGMTVLNTIENDKILENVNTVGNKLGEMLNEIIEKYPFVAKSVGLGFARGIKLNDSFKSTDIIAKMLDKGFILCTAGNNTIRIVPPLIMDTDNTVKMINALKEVLDTIKN